MTIVQKIEILIQYMKVKMEERDWRRVSDCANDIRILEAKLSVVREDEEDER
jgi:hypothetical protein